MGAAQWISGAHAALAAGMTAAAVASATGPGDVQYASEGLGLTTSDGLQRVENWGFGYAFVKPGVDLARYDSVVIGAVSIAYKAPRSPAHASRDGIQRGIYLLPPHTANAFKRYLQKALANEFGKSEGLVVTQRPASNAIRVTSYIPANQVSSAAAARQIFRESATRLRRRLDEIRALPETPPAPKLTRNEG